MKYSKVVVSAFGEPEVLKVVDDELRQPDPGEVLVRVHSAGVARSDCNRRSSDWFGHELPFSLGFDFAGRVEALGDGVTSFEVGQTVAGINENLNSYAEYVYISPDWMVPIPKGVDLAQAACLGLNYLVALQCLQRLARVRAGERILVLGASGGVGTALIELGKLLGLEVYGTATTTKIETIQKLGAIPIDYKKDDFEQLAKGVEFDAIYDGVFDRYFEPAYNHLHTNGKYIVFGFAAQPQEYDRLFEKVETWGMHNDHENRKLIHHNILLEPYRNELSPLVNYLASGQINPLVYERVPLHEAPRAHRLLESGVVTGKVVLTCN